MLASKRLMFESAIELTARGKMKPEDVEYCNILDHTAIGGDYAITISMRDGRYYSARGSREAAYDKLFRDMREVQEATA